MTIQALGYIDTHPLSVLLWRERKLFERAEDGSVRALDIWARLKLKEWSAAKSAVARAMTILTERANGTRPSLAGVSVEKLLPKGHIPWREGGVTDILRFHVPLVTNPGCLNYAGAFSGHVPVGQLTFVATDVLHSAVNLGDTPRYHLLIDVKKPEPELDDAPADRSETQETEP